MTRITVALALTIVTFTGAAPTAGAQRTWPASVANICAHALLFEERHQMGTREGAVAVARDIRASTARRLARIESLPVPPARPRLADRWLGVERRLADVYARSYVRIFDVIDAAKTASDRAREPALLVRLLHAPDRLQRVAARIELRLGVPDCTGGTVRPGRDASVGDTVWVSR